MVGVLTTAQATRRFCNRKIDVAQLTLLVQLGHQVLAAFGT